VHDCTIDTDLEILIPDEYVSSIKERMSLYKDLDDIEEEEKLAAFEKNLIDRFGPIPREVKELLNAVRLREMAIRIGFEKIVLKNNKLIGYFISNQNSPFYQSENFSKILLFVQNNSRLCRMKEGQGKLSLTFDGIRTIEEGIRVMSSL
jgi:transcription-repair coupling factor (superfamily II helicase)